MKKIICLLLSVCMLLCLTACHENMEQLPETESIDTTENQDSTESQESTISTENKQGEEADKMRVLTLEKALHTYYEWVDDLDKALVKSEHSIITLGQEDAKAFPEMTETLNQIATMQENAMLDEFDNLVSTAREELASNRDGFETYVSTLDVQVRRADQVVISLLSDSYSDYGRIENYRAFHGSNYDPQSGKELALNDVVKEINNDLALAVQEELTGHMWTGDFYSEYAVEDYFANTPYDGFSWTVDCTGVTFYFAPGDLCDEGAMTATVSFAKHSELFYEKYMMVTSEYTAELPLDLPFFTQLDADGAFEEISVSGYYDEERGHYTKYGIYTDTDGQYYEEDCYAHDFHPYYVKAADGNYVYLFCEDFEEGRREMRLVVLILNEDGSVTKSGEMNVSPSWLADNKFIVPTDPGSLILDDADNGTEKVVFSIGNNGIPSK